MATATSRLQQTPGPGDAGRTAASRGNEDRSVRIRRARVLDADRRVGARMRERRVTLGLKGCRRGR